MFHVIKCVVLGMETYRRCLNTEESVEISEKFKREDKKKLEENKRFI